MISRLTRSTIALVIVLAAYWIYALLAVPWIEPEAQARTKNIATADDLAQAKDVNRPYAELLGAYFPAGHWVHDHPKLLENEDTMLLIRDYQLLEGGRVELIPCIMIFFPERKPESRASRRQAVILEARQGAVLQFENGFDLTQAKIGRLEHGVLQGEITIHSDMQRPGPDDDLQVITRDVQISESRIWTPHDVRFRLGENVGHGSEMEIRMRAANSGAGQTSSSVNLGGLQSLQLARNVHLNLQLGGAGLLPQRGEQKSAQGATAAKTPVEVTCRGPFHFNLQKHVATFEEQVDVVRINPTGPGDQLTCELLAIHFRAKQPAKPTRKAAQAKNGKEKKASRLEPTRIEALGEPVVVRAPSSDGYARCTRLDYDLLTRKIRLESPQEVVLRDAKHEIHAPAVEYQPSEDPARLGTALASGPGWLHARTSKDPAELFEARWQQKLHLRPHEGAEVISLLGRPQLEMQGMGELTADEVHLWLRAAPQPEQEPADAKQPNVAPDRMLAQGKVTIDSPQLTGATEQLEVWFVPSGGNLEYRVSNQRRAPREGLVPTAQRVPATAPSEALRQPRPTESPQRPARDDGSSPRTAPQSRYDIQGRLIRLKVAMRGKTAEVTDVTVEGDVGFRETQTARPDDRPLLVHGDRLDLAGVEAERTRVTVRGKPAYVEARGMSLQGAEIFLDRGENRLWIDGAGRMTLPVRRDLQGMRQAEQTLAVDWKTGMNFDGLAIHIEGEVEGRGENELLRSESVDIELKERISFAKSVKAQKAQVHRVDCRGGVYLENRTVEDRKLVAIDRMTAKDLSINQTSGDLSAQGPGWVSSTRLGDSDPLGQHPLNRRTAKPRESDRPAALKSLKVEFQRALKGNTVDKEIRFFGQVRCAHGPVSHWDAQHDLTDPDAIGEQGVLLNCNQLTVSEMPPRRAGRGSIELEALGNTVVEGSQFTARANRMTYTQAKERIVLEGTARTDAQLWRQSYMGGPLKHVASRRILYMRNSGKVEIDSFRFLDLTEFGQSPRSKAPPLRAKN